MKRHEAIDLLMWESLERSEYVFDDGYWDCYDCERLIACLTLAQNKYGIYVEVYERIKEIVNNAKSTQDAENNKAISTLKKELKKLELKYKLGCG